MGKRGHLAKPTKARLRLFSEHIWLVALLYAKWGGFWRARMAGCEEEDVLQAARMGLWLAALKYDKRRKLSFAALATPCIRWAMHDAIEFARYGKHKHGRELVDHSQMLRLSERDCNVRP